MVNAIVTAIQHGWVIKDRKGMYVRLTRTSQHRTREILFDTITRRWMR